MLVGSAEDEDAEEVAEEFPVNVVRTEPVSRVTVSEDDVLVAVPLETTEPESDDIAVVASVTLEEKLWYSPEGVV